MPITVGILWSIGNFCSWYNNKNPKKAPIKLQKLPRNNKEIGKWKKWSGNPGNWLNRVDTKSNNFLLLMYIINLKEDKIRYKPKWGCRCKAGSVGRHDGETARCCGTTSSRWFPPAGASCAKALKTVVGPHPPASKAPLSRRRTNPRSHHQIHPVY